MSGSPGRPPLPSKDLFAALDKFERDLQASMQSNSSSNELKTPSISEIRRSPQSKSTRQSEKSDTTQPSIYDNPSSVLSMSEQKIALPSIKEEIDLEKRFSSQTESEYMYSSYYEEEEEPKHDAKEQISTIQITPTPNADTFLTSTKPSDLLTSDFITDDKSAAKQSMDLQSDFISSQITAANPSSIASAATDIMLSPAAALSDQVSVEQSIAIEQSEEQIPLKKADPSLAASAYSLFDEVAASNSEEVIEFNEVSQESGEIVVDLPAPNANPSAIPNAEEEMYPAEISPIRPRFTMASISKPAFSPQAQPKLAISEVFGTSFWEDEEEEESEVKLPDLSISKISEMVSRETQTPKRKTMQVSTQPLFDNPSPTKSPMRNTGYIRPLPISPDETIIDESFLSVIKTSQQRLAFIRNSISSARQESRLRQSKIDHLSYTRRQNRGENFM